MAKPGTATANLKLTVGGLIVSHPITVPDAAVPASEIVPALQQLVDAVVDAASAGKSISCREGCGACCRQLVPISASEGERLLDVIAALPAARREVLEARFASAEARLRAAGLAEPAGSSDRELSTAYFALGLACPFLEEESCSIHAERPLICREYLVTSPAALCANPGQEGVTPVPVPKLSLAARGLEGPGDGWFPLAMLQAWARTRPPTERKKRTGKEWIGLFLRQLATASGRP